MKPAATLCATALLAVSLGCNQSSGNHDADVSSVQATESQWNQDYAARDANKIVDHYADDAILMVPGAPASSGKDAIRRVILGMAADPAMNLKFTASRVEVAKSGDVAYTQGTYTLTMTDPQTKKVIHDHGSYVTTYHKQSDGTWKAMADIATSEVPPVPPPAS